ncbi:hypothetical protein BN977_02893 [Mycolicibacterium cosmeticum]|uniref:Uncharacterized protein n=1 Tax=Mycolicibacterium cosmeticum TaxID=258533 RepID=W9AQR0_MYCCO|nr:hypothetical protein BN977_02893 [Mycolicibacterium cosmeticum]
MPTFECQTWLIQFGFVRVACVYGGGIDHDGNCNWVVGRSDRSLHTDSVTIRRCPHASCGHRVPFDPPYTRRLRPLSDFHCGSALLAPRHGGWRAPTLRPRLFPHNNERTCRARRRALRSTLIASVTRHLRVDAQSGAGAVDGQVQQAQRTGETHASQVRVTAVSVDGGCCQEGLGQRWCGSCRAVPDADPGVFVCRGWVWVEPQVWPVFSKCVHQRTCGPRETKSKVPPWATASSPVVQQVTEAAATTTAATTAIHRLRRGTKNAFR